jgi:hypothetical protein
VAVWVGRQGSAAVAAKADGGRETKCGLGIFAAREERRERGRGEDGEEV